MQSKGVLSEIIPQERPRWDPPQPSNPAAGVCGLWGKPRLRLHRIVHPDWQLPLLRIAIVADLHVCWPWVSLFRQGRIIDQVNGLGADLILLAGDYLPDKNLPAVGHRAYQIIPPLARLSAPMGVMSVLGNHDWKAEADADRVDDPKNEVADEFAKIAIPCLQNSALEIPVGEDTFWLVGLDSQRGRGKHEAGRENPAAAYRDVPAGAPVILLAHEPDYFVRADPRPIAQISGHTHGGQFSIGGRRPMTPSWFRDRFADGHLVEQGRHLIVSAGIGYSGLPFRFGVPPELTLIELSGPN